MENTASFLRDPANGIRKGLAIGEHLFPRSNVNLFRGGHVRDEWWRTVRRHGTFAAKSAFNVAAVFGRLSLPVILNFSAASRHEKGAFPADSRAIYFSPGLKRI